MTEHRNGGAAVAQTLAADGVDTIFGIPGTHNLEIYRHLQTTGIRAVTPRHEQGAGYAAEAYARVTASSPSPLCSGGFRRNSFRAPQALVHPVTADC